MKKKQSKFKDHIIKGYTYRLYPTKEQEQILVNWSGQNRFLWNKFLELNNEQYQIDKKFLWRQDLQRKIINLKTEFEWIKESPAQSLQNMAKRFDTALTRFIKDKKDSTKSKKAKSQYPKYKKRKDGFVSIEIPQQNIYGIYKQITWDDKFVSIPKMDDPIKFEYHRQIEGRVLSIFIRQEPSGKWYITFLCHQGKKEPIKELPIINPDDVVGIDLGIKTFYYDSDGNTKELTPTIKKRRKQLVKKQRKLSRQRNRNKQQNSKNLNKTRRKLAKEHERIRNIRKDHHHQLSSSIAKEYELVMMETLNIKGMMQNHKLARNISEQGWYLFICMMKYKSKFFHQIDRWVATSQICSNCGHKHPMPLDERTYVCSSCGIVMNRDHNGAKNVKDFGIEEIRRTGGTSGTVPIMIRDDACGDVNPGGMAQAVPRDTSLKQENPSEQMESPLGGCRSLDLQ